MQINLCIDYCIQKLLLESTDLLFFFPFRQHTPYPNVVEKCLNNVRTLEKLRQSRIQSTQQPVSEIWSEVMFYTCLSVHRVGLRGGLHLRGFASGGSASREVGQIPPPCGTRKAAIRILPKCFLVFHIQ